MAVGEFEAAIDDLNNAIEMEPCNPCNSFNRAMAILSLLSHTNAQHAGKSLFVLTKQQREQDEALSLRAVKDLSRVIDLEPENLEALCNRGTLFGIRNEFEKAIKDYTTALTMPAITPDMAARVRFNRASAYRAIGDRAGAIQDYSAVVDHGVPYSGEKEQVCMACVHLATLEAEQGNQAHALKAIQSALTIDPSFAPVRTTPSAYRCASPHSLWRCVAYRLLRGRPAGKLTNDSKSYNDARKRHPFVK